MNIFDIIGDTFQAITKMVHTTVNGISSGMQSTQDAAQKEANSVAESAIYRVNNLEDK